MSLTSELKKKSNDVHSDEDKHVYCYVWLKENIKAHFIHQGIGIALLDGNFSWPVSSGYKFMVSRSWQTLPGDEEVPGGRGNEAMVEAS